MAVTVLGSFVIVICVGLGAILVVRGLQSGLPHATCGNRSCRYDVRGLMVHTDRCPECGSKFEEVGITPPGRGRNGGLIVTGLFVILVPIAGGLMASFALASSRRQAQQARQSILLLPSPNAAAPPVLDPPLWIPPKSTLEELAEEESDFLEDE